LTVVVVDVEELESIFVVGVTCRVVGGDSPILDLPDPIWAAAAAVGGVAAASCTIPTLGSRKSTLREKIKTHPPPPGVNDHVEELRLNGLELDSLLDLFEKSSEVSLIVPRESGER
jgi:hypothetical protein